MDNTKETEKYENDHRLIRLIAEEKYKFILFGCLAVGIALGSISCAVYSGDESWNGIVESYCGNYIGTSINITVVTVGFVAVIFLCGLLKTTSLIIYPVVCFRGMGLGALVCEIIKSGETMGLCFVALAVLPYAVVSSALAVYAGEYSLGIHSSFEQKNSGLTKGLVKHTLKIFAIYLLVSILSCALFVISCRLFGAYLL